jgi:Uma2 family endonuclease
MATQVERRRFTVDDYHRMAEAGILTEDDNVELIEGEIVLMSPIGGRHMARVNELNWLLSRQLGDDVRVSVQNPVRLGPYSEPEPDLAVIRARDYGGELPTPEDVLLLIEVADSSTTYDREVKLPMYACAGIPETWLAVLPDDLIERHTEPSELGYRLIAKVGRGERLPSAAIPSLVLDVDAVLG